MAYSTDSCGHQTQASLEAGWRCSHWAAVLIPFFEPGLELFRQSSVLPGKVKHANR